VRVKCFRAAALLAVAAAGPAPAQAGVAFSDERPAGEAKARYLSVSIFSCDYFIRELTDEGRAVERGAALRDAAAAALAQVPGEHRLELRSYLIYLNYGSAEMHDAFVAGAGAIGGALVGPGPKPKCSREKTPHGWFDPAETSNGNPPIVVEIAAALDGQPLAVRSVYSPSVPLSPISTWMPTKAKMNLTGRKAAPEVAAAIAKANDALLVEVKAKLSGG
jgi:hypothetical protein